MKRQIFLGIGLFILLLPFVNSATPLVDAGQDTTFPSSPSLNAVADGDKLVYNVSTFEYGDGIWETLNMLLQQVGAPEFDKGIIGSLEGTELITYIGKTDTFDLYEYDYSNHTYENQTSVNAMNIFSFLKLNQELGVYADLANFSFPADFRSTDYSYYHDYWYYSEFDDPIDEHFWSNFNGTFAPGFANGYNAAFNGWNHDAWEPNAHDYGDSEIGWFAQDWGYFVGYDIAFHGYYQNSSWNDWTIALDAFYMGFNEGWEEGFLEGRLDFNSTRIPDKRYSGVIPAPADLYDYARYYNYQRAYEMFYTAGYRYEAARIDFNSEMYNDLYDNVHDTWRYGYVEGFGDYNYGYWAGKEAGENSWPFNYYDKYWDPYDSYEQGFNVGAYDGYVMGYDDGQFTTSFGEQKLNGMHNYVWNAYFDGFEIGAADYIAYGQPGYDNTTTLPYPTPINAYEDGANLAYGDQYVEGYNNGFLYATLASSADPIDWLWHAGPFYYMNLPYFDFTLDAGSIAPTPMMGFTMLTDLELLVDRDWEFHDSLDYGHFGEPIIPMQTFYAGDTNWASMDTYSKYRAEDNDTEEIITTYDVANDVFFMDFKLYIDEPGLSMNVTWCYDTVTGYLLNVTNDLSFNSMDDVWASIVVELDPARTDNISPVMPTPDTWSYSINNFAFYYDLPATVDPDFADGVAEFKTNGLDSIGSTFLTVDMIGYDGLWAEALMTLTNPTNASDYSSSNYEWPIFSPQGPQWTTDYELIDGVFTTLNSIFGATTYVETALNALVLQSPNDEVMNLYDLDLNLEAHTFVYSGGASPVNYYYVTVDAALDLEFDMLNGDFEWETTTQEGWVRGTIWVGVDQNSGVVLGAGAKTSFDFEMTQTPDYGMNGGFVTAYMEIMIGSTFGYLPDLYSVLSGLPAVPEYTAISIITIIGLASIASAVIFAKKR